jgi:hypothetical protein
MASRIQLFRQKVALGNHELTEHAKREMEQDRFTISDVKYAIYNGRIARTQRHGGGRRKDVVRGSCPDGRSLEIVCRITQLRRLRIITMFSAK